MISYEPLYRTLKAKNISTYKLINEYGISRSLLDRLKHNLHSAAPNGSWCGGQRQLSAANGSPKSGRR